MEYGIGYIIIRSPYNPYSNVENTPFLSCQSAGSMLCTVVMLLLVAVKAQGPDHMMQHEVFIVSCS